MGGKWYFSDCPLKFHSLAQKYTPGENNQKFIADNMSGQDDIHEEIYPSILEH